MPRSLARAPSELVSSAIHSGTDWLIEVSRRLPDDDKASAALVLLGLSAVTAFEPRAASEITSIARSLAAQADIEPVAGSVAPLVALLAVPDGSPARDDLEKLGATEDQGSSVSVWAARVILDRSMESSDPPVPGWAPLLEDKACQLLLSPGVIRQIANDVAAMTLFGARPMLDLGSTRGSLVDGLSFWAFCCVRDDDLDLLCPLVRALTFLGVDAPACAIDFILDHQRADGRFSAQDLSLALFMRGQAEFDATRQVYLPLTVASLWTLAILP